MTIGEYMNTKRYSSAINYGKMLSAFNRNRKVVVDTEEPFRYVIIDDFLKPEVHKQMKEELKSIPIDHENKYKGVLFTKNPLFIEYPGDWHDAYRMNLNPAWNMKMNFFQTMAWRDYIQEFFSDPTKIYYREFTNEVLTEVHHHEKFSRDGFIHNDYDPTEFLGSRIYDGMDTSALHPDGRACDNRDMNRRYVCKAAASIYYIGQGSKINEDKPAGGQTAFFKEPILKDSLPAAAVEPVENRLVVFETSPISFHASRTNNTTYRDSIYNWWHCEMDFMKKRYPRIDICRDVRNTDWEPSDGNFGKQVDE